MIVVGRLVSSFITLFLLLIFTRLAFSASIAKDGCKDRCGNLKIPYPFGIGTNCSKNPWFEVYCNETSNPPTLHLESIKMEVLSISLEENESIRVKSPIISTNCSGRESSKGVNLTGSPFFFSETMNKFIAAGCNNKASMTGIIEPNIVGCESACVGDTDTLFGPNNTCKTVIPSFIQVFNAKFKSKDPESESTGCKLAFIAEEKWFQRNLKTESSVLQNMDYVEAVLDWIVPDTDNGFDLPGKDLYRTEYRCTIYSFLGVSSVPNASRCYCQDGFEGNPYLPNGCQDIDECQDDPKRRCGNATCVNRPGHYVCEKAKTWIIILGISLGFGVLCLAIGAWFLCKYLKERRNIKLKKKFFKRNGGLSEGNIEKTEVFTSKELDKATNNFNKDRVLGQDGQELIYIITYYLKHPIKLLKTLSF